MADMADAPGGRSLAFTARSLQFSWAVGGGWGRSLDRQRVNVGFQQVADGSVHQTVTRHRGYAAERLGHDSYSEMTVASRRPRMPGVQVTLVLDDQELRRNPLLQPPSQATF